MTAPFRGTFGGQEKVQGGVLEKSVITVVENGLYHIKKNMINNELNDHILNIIMVKFRHKTKNVYFFILILSFRCKKTPRKALFWVHLLGAREPLY